MLLTSYGVTARHLSRHVGEQHVSTYLEVMTVVMPAPLAARTSAFRSGSQAMTPTVVSCAKKAVLVGTSCPSSSDTKPAAAASDTSGLAYRHQDAPINGEIAVTYACQWMVAQHHARVAQA